MSLPRPTRTIAQEKTAETEPVKLPVKRYKERDYRPSDVFMFEPMADITAYELACLLRALYEPAVHFKNFLSLPEDIKRHFRPAKI